MNMYFKVSNFKLKSDSNYLYLFKRKLHLNIY